VFPSGLIASNFSPFSRLNRVKPQLPGGLQQLTIAGDEDPAFGPATAPDHCSGKLLSICGLQGKTVHEPLGLFA
jgi:hypothetical protein